MKILYVCRLYSGFEESIKTGQWNPKGAPTIARMIEYLDTSKNHNLTIILTQKNKKPSLKLKPIQTFQLDGLLTPITVISGPNIIPKWSWKFQDKFSDAHQLLRIFTAYFKLKPDIIYCDRVNILPAAFLSRFTKAKVIWRVMGVLQEMHQDADKNSIRSNFRKWLWRSPFKSVICTLDGSGGDVWMNKVLNPATLNYLLINGINKENQSTNTSIKLPDGGIKVLFVGRLESLKGIEEFMESFYEAAKQNKKLHAIIAGDGSLKEDMIYQSKKLKMQNRVHFLGSITPNQLKYVRKNCSFYVSLNKQGNLSNVNIEALYDELPTIIPSSQPEKNIDVDTDNFVPDNVFYRFGKVGDKDALVKAILFMANDSNRNNFKKNMRPCAEKLLPSWPERIKQELAIFDDVLNSH